MATETWPSTYRTIGVLPAGHVPMDVLVVLDDLDSGAAMVPPKVGIWDGSNLSVCRYC